MAGLRVRGPGHERQIFRRRSTGGFTVTGTLFGGDTTLGGEGSDAMALQTQFSRVQPPPQLEASSSRTSWAASCVARRAADCSRQRKVVAFAASRCSCSGVGLALDTHIAQKYARSTPTFTPILRLCGNGRKYGRNFLQIRPCTESYSIRPYPLAWSTHIHISQARRTHLCLAHEQRQAP